MAISIYKERLQKLREKMVEYNIDCYLIPTEDFHASEYVGEHFRCREWLTGFTGSAGTAVVFKDSAYVWTDGRYFLQAEKQLMDTGFTLMKQGEVGVLSILDFLYQNLKVNENLGFDGRCFSSAYVKVLKTKLSSNHITFIYKYDLIDMIWKNRPELSHEPIVDFPIEYSGVSREDKIANVRSFMKKKSVDVFLLTSLDDIAWLLNIRGNDIEDNPVPLAYVIITETNLTLYCNIDSVMGDVKTILEKSNIRFSNYGDIYEDVSKISNGLSLLFDSTKVNYRLFMSIPTEVKVFDGINPTLLSKAIKNDVEVKNDKIAHIRDGIAVTKFIYWLKTNVGKIHIDEMSAALKLEDFRKQNLHYKGPSFAPIIAYKEHGAIVHYSATKQTNVELKPESFVLCDTGGQYYEGTTDITRTIGLGVLTPEEKYYYTLVLKGHLALLNAKFPYGVRGLNLDILARSPLWSIGKDYNHGTGHGVGYYLNVHEGPNGFRWKIVPERNDSSIYEVGMITSNEPGIYLENKFGIRHENLMLCVVKDETSFGKFLGFVPLTLVPFDLSAIDETLLNEDEVRELNDYHKLVFDSIHSYLTNDEEEWLRIATHAIKK